MNENGEGVPGTEEAQSTDARRMEWLCDDYSRLERVFGAMVRGEHDGNLRAVIDDARGVPPASHVSGVIEAQPDEAKLVCYETYAAIGAFLMDLAERGHQQAEKLMDNLSAARLVHGDVLPFTDVSDAAPSGLDREQLWALLNDTHGVPGTEAPSLPRSDSKEASDGIEAVLAERNWPSSSKAAGRAGWEAAFRWLRASGVGASDGKVDCTQSPMGEGGGVEG